MRFDEIKHRQLQGRRLSGEEEGYVEEIEQEHACVDCGATGPHRCPAQLEVCSSCWARYDHGVQHEHVEG